MTKGQEIVQGFKSWQDCTGMAQAIDAALTERTTACCGAAMDCRDFQSGAYSGMAQDIAARIWAVDRPPPSTWCEHIAIYESERSPVKYWVTDTNEPDRKRWQHCPICGKPRPT